MNTKDGSERITVKDLVMILFSVLPWLFPNISNSLKISSSLVLLVVLLLYNHAQFREIYDFKHFIYLLLSLTLSIFASAISWWIYYQIYEPNVNHLFYAMFQIPVLPSVLIYGIYGLILIYICQPFWQDSNSKDPSVKVRLMTASDRIGFPLFLLFPMLLVNLMLIGCVVLVTYGLYWVFTNFMPPTIQIFDVIFNYALGPFGYHIYHYGPARQGGAIPLGVIVSAIPFTILSVLMAWFSPKYN